MNDGERPNGVREDAIDLLIPWERVRYSSCVGCQRQIRALQQGLVGSAGQNGKDQWADHIEGAVGEDGGCREYGLEWRLGLEGPLKGPNGVKLSDAMDANVDFKTRSRLDYGLLVRPYELEAERAYVLIVGRIPRYWIQGWLLGEEIREWGVSDPTGTGRPPAYFIPAEHLRPAESLRLWIAASRLQGRTGGKRGAASVVLPGVQ